MKKAIFLWAGCSVLGILFMGYRDESPVRMLSMAGVFAAAVAIHAYRAKRDSSYFKKSFAVGFSKNRSVEYDYLRILAVIMVIATHAIQRDIADGIIGNAPAQYIMTVLYMLCLACNVIYVMLSGALLLPYKEERLSDFYLKRVTKVVIPMFVYFIVYLWMKEELQDVNEQLLADVVKRFIRGETPESPHYWLIYTILSLYIAFPFLRYMLRNMSYRRLTNLVVIIGIFMAVTLFLPVVYTTSAVNTFFSSWVGVAVWGYWISRDETRKYDWILCTMGILAFAVMAILVRCRTDFYNLCCNCSPVMLLVASGIFALVYKTSYKLLRPNYFLGLLSKYSYSIILIHWGVLHWITRKCLQIYTVNYKYIGGTLLSVACTAMVSLIAAIGIDNLVVVVPQEAFDFFVKIYRRGVSKLCGRKRIDHMSGGPE